MKFRAGLQQLYAAPRRLLPGDQGLPSPLCDCPVDAEFCINKGIRGERLESLHLNFQVENILLDLKTQHNFYYRHLALPFRRACGL